MGIDFFEHQILLFVQNRGKFFFYFSIQYLRIDMLLLLNDFVDLIAPNLVFAVKVFESREAMSFVQSE